MHRSSRGAIPSRHIIVAHHESIAAISTCIACNALNVSVAVGTTVVRSLESVADADGYVRGGSGWTNLVISPERGLRVVDAILTGFHDPKASHLSMLEALAGRDHLALAYDAALSHSYLWHEFGDLHLLLKN